jgi:hypothetical protein
MPGMRRQFLFVLTFALLSTTCLFAQKPKSNPLLPDRFGSWTASGPAKMGANQTVLHGDSATLDKETGVTLEETRTYASGSKNITINAIRAHDPSGAYELFTDGLKYGAKRLALGQNAAAIGNNDYGLIQVGDLVLIVEPLGGASPEELNEIVKALRDKTDHTPLPPIPSYLPEAGRVEGSERYALGPVAFLTAADGLELKTVAGFVEFAGFSSGAEAMFAKYKTGANQATLLLIDYPTPQLAEMHLRHFERALSAAKQSGSSVERKGSLLSIVLGPTSAEYAEKLRGAVRYETEVTWNEPSSTATDPPITSTLVKIIVATGVFMMVTLVLGIAFGGVRVITKRLFPGKVFDRPAQMEVLQLGLSGKPIDPRDMY